MLIELHGNKVRSIFNILFVDIRPLWVSDESFIIGFWEIVEMAVRTPSKCINTMPLGNALNGRSEGLLAE